MNQPGFKPNQVILALQVSPGDGIKLWLRVLNSSTRQPVSEPQFVELHEGEWDGSLEKGVEELVKTAQRRIARNLVGDEE